MGRADKEAARVISYHPVDSYNTYTYPPAQQPYSIIYVLAPYCMLTTLLDHRAAK